jgi:hypothetical protein
MMTKSIDEIYKEAKRILIRLRPDEIHRTSSRDKLVDVAIDVLGCDYNDEPDRILMLLCQVYPIPNSFGKTKPNKLVDTGRPLKLDRMMRIAAERCEEHPTQIGLGKSRGPRCE